jgi:hypothetical protein
MNEIVTVQQLIDELSAKMVEMKKLFLKFTKFAIKHFTSLWSFAGIKADASPSMDSDDKLLKDYKRSFHLLTLTNRFVKKTLL